MADATKIVEELRRTREQLREGSRARQRDDEPQYIYDPDTGELKPVEEPRRPEAPRREAPRPQSIRVAGQVVD